MDLRLGVSPYSGAARPQTVERRTFVRSAGLALGAAAASPRSLAAALARRRTADTILCGGLVYDGLGGPPVRADVAIAGDRIAAVGAGLPRAGAAEVDVRGLALPAGAGGGGGEGRGGGLVGVYGCLVAGKSGRRFFGLGRVGVVAAEGDDPSPEPCVGGEDAVIAVAVDPGRRDQAREGFEEFER